MATNTNLHQLRRTTAPVIVAKRDFRKRYGLEAIGTIPAGTLVTYSPGDYAEWLPASVDFIVDHTRYYGAINKAACEEFLAKSEAHTPGNFKEVCLAHDCRNTSESGGAEVIQALIDAGKVSLADAEAALVKVMFSEE